MCGSKYSRDENSNRFINTTDIFIHINSQLMNYQLSNSKYFLYGNDQTLY